MLLEQLLLSKQCAREAASPGASWHWNRVVFEIGRQSFFESFFEAQFFIKVSDLQPNIASKWTCLAFVRAPFFEKYAEAEKCVWTAQACTDCIWATPMERQNVIQN